jgi:hypothetical protein
LWDKLFILSILQRLNRDKINKTNIRIDFIQYKIYFEFRFMTERASSRKTWIEFLDEEDIAFLKRFVLLSGSMKDLATAYDVSYPTVRLRLDRLIAKVTVFDDQQIEDDFERQLRALYAEGKLEAAALKKLLVAYRRTQT